MKKRKKSNLWIRPFSRRAEVIFFMALLYPEIINEKSGKILSSYEVVRGIFVSASWTFLVFKEFIIDFR